jgi:hypothetical protein
VRADFDWAGLGIAGAALARPGARPWRYRAADYEGAVRRLVHATARLAGAQAPSPWDPALAAAMGATGRAVFEEELLDDLVADLARAD